MGEEWNWRQRVPPRNIEAEAAMYRDPVKRLRFLRRAEEAWTLDGSEPMTPRRRRRRWVHWSPLLLIVLVLVPIPTASDMAMTTEPVILTPEPHPADEIAPKVWLVEDAADYELYSNGLRIEKRFEVKGEKRPYPVFDAETLELIEWRSGPIGILYHTTESNIAPFEENQNKRLRRIGQWLLEYVHKNRAYHYVIDRFGRVQRVVRETDTANHAGYSVWADGRKVYVNLNPSFLGISFEAETASSADGPAVSEAQLHAARVLTDMLRSKYGIRARNCVTHAQVSVAPWNMRFGNHVDWAASFPFGMMGLQDNYAIPTPALSVFGFRYDSKFLKSTGKEFWVGVALGQDEFRRRAISKKVSLAKYRAARNKRYRAIIEALEDVVEAVEKTS